MKYRGRRYADGGGVGYEESPEPGVQLDRETPRKKPAKKGTEPRRMSSEEFVREYEKSASSPRMRGETRSVTRVVKGPKLPSDRATNFASQAEETGMTPDERAEAARKGIVTAASLVPAVRGASLAAKGLKTAKRRYDIGKRVDAMTEGQQKSAFLRAAREAREVDDMKSGGRVKRYASGGSVSSASKRADGCATKGKTRGKFV